MLNEVKHLVLRPDGYFLPGTRFFVAALLKNDIVQVIVISNEPWIVITNSPTKTVGERLSSTLW
jgi:hypothetical protein